MNTQANTEVHDYLERMRDALSDLPAAEVGEIMDDAGAHVVEVAEEMGDDFTLAALTDRLGTPQDYAQELRAAAGYPSPSAAPEGSRPTALARFALWSLIAGTVVAFGFAFGRGDGEEIALLVGLCAAAATVLVFRQASLLPEIARLPETTTLTDAFRKVEQSDSQRLVQSLRALQPLWWVARALLIAATGVLATRPSFFLVACLALGALSLLAGPKARVDRRWLWISLPATGFALGILLLLLGSLVDRGGYPRSAPVSYNPSPPAPANIYVFDKDGKPLTDVHLYDENGQPLNAPWYGCEGVDRRDDNRYPRPRVVRDENGCRELPGVPFAVIMPTTTTPSPSVSSLPPTTTAPTTTPPPTTQEPTSVPVPPTG